MVIFGVTCRRTQAGLRPSSAPTCSGVRRGPRSGGGLSARTGRLIGQASPRLLLPPELVQVVHLVQPSRCAAFLVSLVPVVPLWAGNAGRGDAGRRTSTPARCHSWRSGLAWGQRRAA